MADAIGQILPLAVAVALSPFPIVAVVLMLVTPRARVNGPAFVVGWLVGLAAVGVVVLSLAGLADASGDGRRAGWVSWLELLLGVLLLLLAVRQWRGRPRAGEEVAEPKWMGAVDHFGPGRAFGLGILLSAANPKNLLLAVAASAAIAETGIPVGEEIVAYAVFALVGTIGVGAPIVLFFTLGERSAAMLDGLKSWMSRNNAAIMAVLLLVIGAKVIGDAISGF